MQISGSVALVTGANRGIGRAYAQALVARGAGKVYATARNPESVDIEGVQVLVLDVTDPESVRSAAGIASDVTLLVNNAGVAANQNLVTGDLERIRQEMETNYFGPLNVVRAFAPVLAGNGGGAILNMLSVLSWLSVVGANAYAVTKAAAWSMTNGIRLELAPDGIQVVGLHVGFVDTDMLAGWDIADKLDPAVVAAAGLDGIEAGELEVVVDDASRLAKTRLAEDPRLVYASDVVGG